MAIGSLVASRSSRALAAATTSQAPRVAQHTTTSPMLTRLGAVARAFSSNPAAAEVNSGVCFMEGKTRRVGNNAKGAKSGKAMMFPLHFHYDNVLRQDLLLKLNRTNIMEVPGLFEIRLVPKASSDFKIQFGKSAMEILCGQRCIQAQLPPYLQAGKSSRSNPFLGSQKDAASLRQRSPRAWNVQFSGQSLDSNVYVGFSGSNRTGKLHQVLHGNGVLRVLPRNRRSFRDL